MSQKPPKCITIASVKYDVVMVKKLQTTRKGETTKYFGLCYSLPARIKIEKRQPPVQLAATMLHEVFHAIFHHTGQRDGVAGKTEEPVVSALAYGLVDVLKRNPKLFDWLIEQIKDE